MTTTLAVAKSARIETSIAAFEDEVVHAENEPCLRMNALLHSCCSLWREWRSLIETISTEWDVIDLHATGDRLRPLIAKTANRFHAVKDMTEREDYTQCGLDGACDLALACHEIDNAMEWFDSFPTYDSSRRDISRHQLATGKGVDLTEIAECL